MSWAYEEVTVSGGVGSARGVARGSVVDADLEVGSYSNVNLVTDRAEIRCVGRW